MVSKKQRKLQKKSSKDLLDSKITKITLIGITLFLLLLSAFNVLMSAQDKETAPLPIVKTSSSAQVGITIVSPSSSDKNINTENK